MIQFQDIYEESEDIARVLQKKGLLKQYLAAKKKMLSGGGKGLDLKMREPKRKCVYSFRINKQYRAFGVEKEGCLIIFEINDHSNF